MKRKKPVCGSPPPEPSAPDAGLPRTVGTWAELAERLCVTRMTLNNWRNDPRYAPHLPKPNTSNRHDVPAWRQAMRDLGLSGKGADQQGGFPGGTVADWRRRREQLVCEKLQVQLDKMRGALMETAALEVAIGQMLAGFVASLYHFPASAARFLVGLRDTHLVQERLEAEVNTLVERLAGGRYLDLAPEDVASSFPADQRDTAIAAIREMLSRAGRIVIEQGARSLPEAADGRMPEKSKHHSRARGRRRKA